MISKGTRLSGFGWFACWAAVGAAYTTALLGALSIGIFVLPVAVLATWYLARHDRSAGAVSGGLSGIGLPLLYVAAMNREGPGVVCHGQTCGQQWSPWP